MVVIRHHQINDPSVFNINLNVDIFLIKEVEVTTNSRLILQEETKDIVQNAILYRTD